MTKKGMSATDYTKQELSWIAESGISVKEISETPLPITIPISNGKLQATSMCYDAYKSIVVEAVERKTESDEITNPCVQMEAEMLPDGTETLCARVWADSNLEDYTHKIMF